jgi:hypothetical protein
MSLEETPLVYVNTGENPRLIGGLGPEKNEDFHREKSRGCSCNLVLYQCAILSIRLLI